MTYPCHIAIIMDGNGRWARNRGLPRLAGHRAGMEVVHKIVNHAGKKGVEWLTLFAFSSENWSRPEEEVSGLMGLLKLFIRRDLAELHKNNVRVRVIGGRAHLNADILNLLEEAETLTKGNSGLNLVIAFNYGGRDEITRATKRLVKAVEEGQLESGDVCAETIGNYLDTAGMPEPDILIRTSGEQRLSNFLLWQIAYSELAFVDCFWPDFSEAEFDAVVEDFNKRERRFGNISQQECKRGAV